MRDFYFADDDNLPTMMMTMSQPTKKEKENNQSLQKSLRATATRPSVHN
jgi:hypothetical protein